MVGRVGSRDLHRGPRSKPIGRNVGKKTSGETLPRESQQRQVSKGVAVEKTYSGIQNTTLSMSSGSGHAIGVNALSPLTVRGPPLRLLEPSYLEATRLNNTLTRKQGTSPHDDSVPSVPALGSNESRRSVSKPGDQQTGPHHSRRPNSGEPSNGDVLDELQVATTGLLARHISNVDRAVPLRTAVDHEESAQTAALLSTLPKQCSPSGQSNSGGLDDRITPQALHMLIQRGRREQKKYAREKGVMFSGFTPQESVSPSGLGKAQRSPRFSQIYMKSSMDAETQAHEPPVLQAAYRATFTSESPMKVSGQGPSIKLPRDHNEEEILYESRTSPAKMTHAEAEAACDSLFRSFYDEAEPASMQRWQATSSCLANINAAAASSTNDTVMVQHLVNLFRDRPSHNSSGVGFCQSTTSRPLASSASSTDRRIEAPTEQNLVETEVSRGNALDIWSSMPVEEQTSAGVNFSLMDAVLSVSREYVSQHTSSGQRQANTAFLSDHRRRILHRLTSIESTQIPESMWVSTVKCHNRARGAAARGPKRGEGKATAHTSLASEDGGTSDHSDAIDRLSKAAIASYNAGVEAKDTSAKRGGDAAARYTDSSLIFPSPWPVERSQVYLLAEAIDQMLRVNPHWLSVLSDPLQATCVLPDTSRSFSVATGGKDLDASVAVDAVMAYSNASACVLQVLDAGLVEVVRQVSCHCVERGALLDQLRQTVIDVAESQVRILAKVKLEAHRRAVVTSQLQQDQTHLKETLASAQERIAALEAEKATTARMLDPLKAKGAYLDELVARVTAKARRYETHRGEEHAALLQLLEENIRSSASEALDSLYEEMVTLRAQYSSTKSMGSGAHDTDLVETPSVAAARSQAIEQRQAMERLYHESHQLLRSLSETVGATNAICAPFYSTIVLNDVSSGAKVAASRWMAVAKAVGKFEREKKHRQRVYEIFTQWCEVHRQMREEQQQQRRLAEGALVSRGEAFLLGNDLISDEESGHRSTDELLNDSAASYMTVGSSDKSASHSGKTLSTEVNPPPATAMAPHSNLPSPDRMLKSPINFITDVALQAMDVTDCTADEINAMFDRNFDFKAYLHTQWPGSAHRNSSVDNSSQTLRLADVVQMISDVKATLAEVTTRLQAISQNGVLQLDVTSALKPPANPEVPCPLCNRCDTQDLDRRRRQEVMARIARDLQGRMETMRVKCQKAQSEREEARAEVRRLQTELEYVQAQHQKVPPKSRTIPKGPSIIQNSSSSLERVESEEYESDSTTPPLRRGTAVMSSQQREAEEKAVATFARTGTTSGTGHSIGFTKSVSPPSSIIKNSRSGTPVTMTPALSITKSDKDDSSVVESTVSSTTATFSAVGSTLRRTTLLPSETSYESDNPLLSDRNSDA